MKLKVLIHRQTKMEPGMGTLRAYVVQGSKRGKEGIMRKSKKQRLIQFLTQRQADYGEPQEPAPEAAPQPVADRRKQHVEHHVWCGCGRRLVMKGAQRCWLCEEKEPVFADLDRLITAGVDTPQSRLI